MKNSSLLKQYLYKNKNGPLKIKLLSNNEKSYNFFFEYFYFIVYVHHEDN